MAAYEGGGRHRQIHVDGVGIALLPLPRVTLEVEVSFSLSAGEVPYPNNESHGANKCVAAYDGSNVDLSPVAPGRGSTDQFFIVAS